MTKPPLLYVSRPPLRMSEADAMRNDGVPLDLDKLVETRLLIQANSGGGKSYAIRYLLEQTYGKIQHIVIDREGEFSTLREKYPYLLVGRDGDVAADIGTAKLLARKVLELGLSTVVDLSEMSPGQQRAYVRVFIDSLNHAPRSLWKDCLIVIDEAHIFAPESGKGASEATESIALLLSTGRKRGFCPVLATQRLAKLNKDVAAECLNKLIGRTSNEDLKRAADELAQGKQSSIQLRGLEPGTFWAYGPAIGLEPMLVRTGEVGTNPPARGAERSTPPAAPEEIRAALAKELAELPQQAADEAQSVQALAHQVAELSRELGIAKRAQPERVKETIRVTVPDVALGRQERARGIRHIKKMADMAGQISNIAAQMMDYADFETKDATWPETLYLPETVQQNSGKGIPTAPVHMHTVPISRPRSDAQPLRQPTSINGVPSGARRILETLADYPGAVTRGQLGKLAKFAIKGGTFNNYFNMLKRSGWVEENGNQITITDDGLAKLGRNGSALTTSQQWEKWQSALNKGEREILATIVEHRNGITRERLGEFTDYATAGGTFSNYVNALKRNGLIIETAGKYFIADKWAGLA